MAQPETNRWGVILMNLGTPEAATSKAVRQFLTEFLSDTRVVEMSHAIWLPILHGIILPFRATRVARLYEEIWLDEGSPLKVVTETQVTALQSSLKGEGVKVTYAMTYGKPKLEQRVAELEAEGINRILVLPLYPQYSATTTAAIYDQYSDLIAGQRNISNIVIHKHYYERTDYHQALVHSVHQHWQRCLRAEKLLFSFHGIPQRCVDLGDPYYDHCRHTAERVALLLGLTDDQWAFSFQSRMGKAQWLEPYTDKKLERWAKEGVESVDVICPAFSADCLETIEEIDKENRAIFIKAGGRRFEFIPCLNAEPLHIAMMRNIVKETVR